MSEIQKIFCGIGMIASVFGIGGFIFWIINHIVVVFEDFKDFRKQFENETNRKIQILFERVRELEEKLEPKKEED